MEAQFHFVDGLDLIGNTLLNYKAQVIFGEDNNPVNTKSAGNGITLSRTGSEEPVLQMNATFLTDTSQTMVSG